ncbi:hypothetical protein [Mangrovibacterium lignilyticum]|uniref:hypothetical protein n=1 Tax=Mangrovibacterium lignilyticum TaxID=2668052 RepID=UPI0013D8AB62|nr:hypothetical protein [Mangrovibacterium lignilyticum]
MKSIFLLILKTRASVCISSVIFISCLLLVATGSPILGNPVLKDSTFPIGTIISWAGLIALLNTTYLVFNKNGYSHQSSFRLLRLAFQSMLILASAWGLIGFLLAGNWAFTFQNQDEFRGSIEASQYFVAYTVAIVLVPVFLLLVAWFTSPASADL